MKLHGMLVGSVLFFGLGTGLAQEAGEGRRPVAGEALDRDPESPVSLRLVADREYGKAAEALAAELAAKPDEDRVRLLLGLAQLRGKQAEAALATLGPLSKKTGSAWAMRALYLMAEAQVQRGDYAGAAELYAGATERLLSGERKAELAQIYVDLGKRALEPAAPGSEPDPAKAASLFALALELLLKPAGREELLRARAEALAKAGSAAEAAAVWGKLLAEFPDSAGAAQAALEQALRTLATGNPLEARRLLTALLGRFGSSPLAGKAQLALASTFGMPSPGSERDLERGVAALRKFVAAHADAPEVPLALLQIGQAFVAHGRTDDAIAAYSELIASYAKKPELEELAQARVQLGQLLAAQQRHGEATDVYQAYLREHPSHRDWANVQGWLVDAEYERAMLIYAMARARAAEKEHESGAAAEPADEVNKKLLAARAAMELFLQAHPLDERNPELLYTIGESHALEKATDKATEIWRRLASKYPDTEPASHGLFRTAELLEAGGKLADALEAFKKVSGGWYGAAQGRFAELQQPALEVQTRRSFRSTEKPSVHLVVRNIPSLTLKAYRLDLQTYFRKTHGTSGIESLDIALIDPDSTWKSEIPGYKPLERQELDLPMPFGEQGVWLVHFSSETLEATTMLLVTDLELLVRTVGRDALVYAQEPSSGAAREGVSVLLSSTDKVVAEGKTGKDGVWLYHGSEDEEAISGSMRVFGWLGKSVAATDLEASGTDYGSEIESRALMFSDRPVYKPGDRVGIKAFVRLEDNGVLKTAEGRELSLEVSGPTGQLMLSRTLRLSEWGSVAAELELPRQAPTGTYRMRLHDEESSFEDSFRVEHYQLPKVLLSIEPAALTVARGTPVEGTIRARHAYGEPIAGARVRYGLRQDPLAEGVTDERGELRFQFPTTEMGEEQSLDIFAELPAEALSASTSATVVVAPTQFELSVSTSSELYLAGERFEASVNAEDWAGKAFSPQVRLELVELRTDAAGGQVERVAQAEVVPLDAAGVGRVGLTARKGGAYVLRARAADALGNPVSAEREIRISGQEDEQKLHLLTELSSLMVGQKAELRLHSRLRTAAPALLTFEGAGIFGYRLERVAPGDGKLAVDAQSEYAPNFAVNVSALGDGALHEARAEFSVRQGLTVEIRLASQTAPPGTEAEAEIRTLDHLGKPVSAEVALAVVDEALLALHPDTHPSMAEVFYGGSRELSGSGACSCAFAYNATTESISQEVVAELAKVQASRQRAGRLEEAANAMDSNKMMAPNIASADTPMAAPMQQSGMAYGEGGVAGGVVGGSFGRGGAAPPPPPPLVRKRFAETAYWAASVVTDAAGKATVRFRMPDSTTGWRWLARGADRTLLVGQAEARSVTKLDLMAEVQLPAAFVEGDRASVRATAHNLSATAQTIATRFAWKLGELTGMTPGQMQLAAGEQQAADMDVPAQAPGKLVVTWNAGTDVLERSVPVLPWGVEESDQKVGVATGERSVSVELPAGATQNLRLQIRLGLRWDRVIYELWQGSPELRSFGAAHAEEAYQVLAAATAVREEERRGRGKAAAEVRGALGLALGDLIAGQNADGGWAYAGRGPSDPLISAEGLAALAQASGSGFEAVVRVPRTAAEGRLWQWFREAQEDQLELKATLLWALAESGPVDFAFLNRLYRSRNSLSSLSLARLSIAMVRAGRAEIAAELADLLAKKRLAGSAVPFPEEAILSDGGDPVVVAAFALRALGLARPAAPELAELRDWLLGQRWGGGYTLRRRDAWVAAALFDAGTAAAEAPAGSMRVSIRVNGAQRGFVETGTDVVLPSVVEVPASLIRPGKNEVQFTQAGPGRYSYAVRLQGWNPAPQPRMDEWRIERSYGPAPLVRGGKLIPRGFEVVDGSYTNIENKVGQLELGGFLEATLRISRQRTTPPALRSSHLVVEEPLPAGCTLDADSVAGDYLAFEQQPGSVVFLLPRDRGHYELRFRLLGRFPGAYGVLPTRLSVPDESGRTEIGAARQLTVLGPGTRTQDKVRLTPDELYHLGLWHFEQGEIAQARTYLDELLSGTRLKDEPGHKTTRTLFEIASRLGETREMIRHFENLKERWPESVLSYAEVLRVGQAYREAGEHERAYSVFRAAAEGSFLRDSQVSGALEKEGELDASLEVLESLLREYPPHPTMDAAAYGLGQLLVLVAQGKGPASGPRSELATPATAYARASRIFQNYIVEHSDSPVVDEVSFAWLSTLLEVEDYPAAVALARRCQGRYPQSVFLPSFEYVEGYALFELRRYEDALGVLSHVAGGTYKRRDGTTGPSANRALCLLLAGQIQQAKQDMDAALGLYEQVQDEFPEARELRDYYRRPSLAMPEVTNVLPGEQAAVELTERNLREVQLQVYKVDLMMLYLREKNLDSLTGIELSGIAPDHEASVPIATKLEYRERKISVKLPLTEPGAYLVVARAGEVDASGMVLVTELGLTADEQQDSGRVRLFLETQKTHEPVGRAHVKVVGSRDGLFQSGDTDLRGIFTADNVQGVVTAIARSADHYAFFRGSTELQPVRTQQSPSFDRKSKAMENLRRDLDEIQQQRMQDLRGIQYNEAQGVEIKNAYK